MFNNPRHLANFGFCIVLVGLALQSIGLYIIPDEQSTISTISIALAMAFYLGAFPLSIVALMRNWRVPKEKRLELWHSVEVGVGLLPFLLTLVLVAYAIWFAGR